MKVVKTGEIWDTQITCNDCKTVLKIDDGDVFCQGYEGTFQVHYYVRCPQCRVKLSINPPQWVKNRANNR